MDEDESKTAANINQENHDIALEATPTTVNYIIDRVDSLIINRDSSNTSQFDGRIRQCLFDLQHKLRNFYRDVTLPCVSWMDDGRDLLINDFYVDVKLDVKSGSIDIKEIFGNVLGVKPTRILLEGQPGFGKTALSMKLIFDWATEKDYLREFNLAFLIPLRQLHSKSVEVAVKEISKLCGFSKYETTWELIEKNFNKTLLIFDGFDEIANLAREHIFQILYKQLYDEMTVVVTCRTGLFDIRRHELQDLFGGIPKKKLFYDKLITISGIAVDNREKFLRKFSTECDTEIILKFIGKTSSYDILSSPLFLIFLALFAVKKKALLDVTTQTEFYKTLVNCIIRASAERKRIILDEYFNIFDNNSCSSDVFAENFYEFGVLSFTKILEKTLQFECNEFSKKIYDMGFLTHYKNLLFFDSTRSYEPFHLSFLEFSCAYALKRDFENNKYNLSDDIIDKVLKIDLQCDSSSLIFPFLFGLLEKKSDVMFQQMKPFAHKISFAETTFWSIIAECQIELPLIADFFPLVITHKNAKFANLDWTPYYDSVLRNGIKENKIVNVITELKLISRYPLDVVIRSLNLKFPLDWDFSGGDLIDFSFGLRDLIHLGDIQCYQLILNLCDISRYWIHLILMVFKFFWLKPVKKKYLYLNDSYGCQDLICYLQWNDGLPDLKLTKLDYVLHGSSENSVKFLYRLLGNNQVKHLILVLDMKDANAPEHDFFSIMTNTNAPEYDFFSIVTNIAKSDYLDTLDLHVQSDNEEFNIDLYVLTNGGCKKWKELILDDYKLICSGHLKNPSCIRCLSTRSTSPVTANTICKLDLKMLKCSESLLSILPVFNTDSIFKCQNIYELGLKFVEISENVNVLNRLKLFTRLETFQIVFSAKRLYSVDYFVECLNFMPLKRLTLCWPFSLENETCVIKELMVRLHNSNVVLGCTTIDVLIYYPRNIESRYCSLVKNVADTISILLKCLEMNSNLKKVNLILNSNQLWQLIVRQNIIDCNVIKVDRFLLEFFQGNLFKYKFSLVQQPILCSSENITSGNEELDLETCDDFTNVYRYFYRRNL